MCPICWRLNPLSQYYAVRKADNAALCVPAFANVTRTIGFTAAYVDPSSGIQPVVVNGSNISAAASNLSLSFDGNGRAPLTVRYNDAGQRSLSAIQVAQAQVIVACC